MCLFPHESLDHGPDRAHWLTKQRMQIAPHTKDGWITLALLPAKLFLVAWLVLAIGGFPLKYVTEGPVICLHLTVPYLLLGALIQRLYCRSGAAVQTLCFVAFLALSVFLGILFERGGIFFPLVCWLFWCLVVLIRRPESAVGESTELECLECHKVIPTKESQCPHCGWTFKV